MNKKILVIAMAMAAFYACSDDSSTSADSNEDFSTEGGSSAVSYNGDGIYYKAKASYAIDTNEKSLTFHQSICEVRDGNLYWSADGGKEETATYKYNESSKSITLSYASTKLSLKFYGERFPYGQWIEPNAENGNVYNGYSFDKSDVVANTKYFGDTCLVDNINTVHMILGLKDATLEKVTCKEAKFKNITYTIAKYSAGVVELIATSGEKKCSVTITPRYAVNEDDCNDAYEEFQNDAKAAKTFDFENYNVDVDGDADCFAEITGNNA